MKITKPILFILAMLVTCTLSAQIGLVRMKNAQKITHQPAEEKTISQVSSDATQNKESDQTVASVSTNEKDQKSAAATRNELKNATESQDLKKAEKDIPAVIKAKPNVEAYEVAKAHAMMEVRASEKKADAIPPAVPAKSKTTQKSNTGLNNQTKTAASNKIMVKKTSPVTVKKIPASKKGIEKKKIQKAKPAASKTSIHKKPVVKQHASKPVRQTAAKKKVATKPVKKPAKKPVTRKR